MTKLLADSNRASLREIIEDNTAWGTTPGAGRTRARRFKTSSITATKATVESEEIRDDRMVSSIIQTEEMSGGDINWEFAAGTPDLDFQRALMGAWSRPMEWDVFRGKGVSITDATHVTISGSDKTPYFTVGRRIKLSGYVNTANNDYGTVSAVAYAGGITTVTLTGVALVAEAGNAASSIADANDVIVLKSTAIRFNNTPFTIDSNGANAFAAANAAGQLVSGQRIFIEGVGYGTGTITLVAPLDNDQVTVSDGTLAITFEAQSNSNVASTADVTFAIGVDDAATTVNLAAAINQARVDFGLQLAASAATDVVTITDLTKGSAVLTGVSASMTVAAFSGSLATAGGFYTIRAVTDDSILLDRAVPTIAVGKKITIKGSLLRNPGNSASIQPQSASIETGFHDVGQYFKVDGLRTGSVELDVSAGAIITGSTKLMGRTTVRASTEKLTGAGYVALQAPSTEVTSATANVGSLIVDGVEQATAIKTIKMTIEGNLRNQMAVGSKFPVGIAAGRLHIKGSIEAYFADGVMYDRFINHDTVSLSFPIVDHDKNTYYFTIPAFKVASDPIAPGGLDQDVMENMEFMAFRDEATNCVVQIDRFSSTAPVTVL